MTNPFAVEPLEPRQLLSITWANRGKADSFDAMYKGSAKVARQIVDAAIADWNKALPKVSVKVRISAFDIEAGQRQQNTLGRTDGTTIQLDKDGAGQRWYFDPDLADNSDFSTARARSAFHATGSIRGADFYSVVAHELAHALGFADTRTPFSRPGYRDAHHSNDANDLMFPAMSEAGGGRRLISPYDISHTTAGRSIKNPVAPRSFFTTTATQGETQLRLNWTLPDGVGAVKVYRATRPGTTPSAAGATLLATPPAAQTIFLDTTASPGVTYYYFVVSTRQPTLQATATGWLGDATPVGTDAVQVSLTSDGRYDVAHITWKLLDGATSYDVYKSTINAGSRMASNATLFSSATTPAGLAGDGGLEYGKGYYYWVVAHFGSATYDYPVPGRIYRMTPTETASATASFESPVITLSLSQFVYDYGPLTGVNHYDVYRSLTYAGTKEASGAQKVGSFLQSDRNYYDFGTPPGVNVYYWVVAVYQPFPDLTITRDLPVLGAMRPTVSWLDFRATGSVTASKGTSATAIEVNWQPKTGAGGYDVYVANDSGYDDPARPSTPIAHIADPAATHFVLDASSMPGDYYNPTPGPRTNQPYRVWVVATPGDGLASPADVGSDRGYVNGVTATGGLPNGIYVSWNANNYGYGFMVFRGTSPTASPTTGGLTFVGGAGAVNYLDTSAVPGVTYYYWIFNAYPGTVNAPIWGTASGYRA